MSEIATINEKQLATVPVEHQPMTAADIRQQVNLIQHVMHEVMKKDEHYGVIPGTGTKPSLLKPGAEKLCLTFRLDPQYEARETYIGEHLTVTTTCTLYHSPTGRRLGSGVGLCTTRESKYAWRNAGRKCPACGKEAIIKGKAEFGGGWVCFKKKDGCGAKFSDGDQSIEGQPQGRVANPDVADCYNTVLKMSAKRALVAAVLNVTAASDIFTQDIEDLPHATSDRDIVEVVAERPQTAPTANQARGKAAMAVGQACARLLAAATLAALAAIWTELNDTLIKQLAGDGFTDLIAELTKAKDSRKAALSATPAGNFNHQAPVAPEVVL